jgi:hypothetical protein
VHLFAEEILQLKYFVPTYPTLGQVGNTTGAGWHNLPQMTKLVKSQ